MFFYFFIFLYFLFFYVQGQVSFSPQLHIVLSLTFLVGLAKSCFLYAYTFLQPHWVSFTSSLGFTQWCFAFSLKSVQ